LNPREQLVQVCRLAYQRGYMAASDGNVSLRLDDGSVLITPSGRCKAFIQPEDILCVDLEGGVISGQGKPSSEGQLHYLVYKERPDVAAVVHAHPPTATAFSLAGRQLDCRSLPELMIHLGEAPTAPYATPTTADLPAAVKPYVAGCDAMLLAHHGSLTMAANLERAWALTEKLEHAAITLLAAEQLGGARPLAQHDLDRLTELGRRYGLRRDAAVQAPPPPLAQRLKVEHLPETTEFATAKRHPDARGMAHLIVDDRPLRRVCLLTLEPGKGFRGGHVHNRKTEGFYVAQGAAVLEAVCALSGEKTRLELGVGDLVWLPPGVAHRIWASQPLVFVELTDRPYDKNDDAPFNFEEA